MDSRIRKTAGALGGPALGVLAIGAIVLCALAALVGYVLDSVLEGDGIAAVDRPTVAWLAEHRHPVLTTVMRVVSVIGSPVSAWAVAVIVCAFVAWRIRHWLPVVVAGLGMAGFSLTVTVVKLVVRRQRPELPYSVIATHGYSFPSGHAMGVTTSALISAWALHHWIIGSAGARIALWTAAIAIIAGVGFSRVYLGVHYPSDVITGWALGVIWVGVLIAFVALVEQRSAAADSTVCAGHPAASSDHDSSSLGNNSSETSN